MTGLAIKFILKQFSNQILIKQMLYYIFLILDSIRNIKENKQKVRN
jgi:hypothetical protein